jgi:hypothetical protein
VLAWAAEVVATPSRYCRARAFALAIGCSQQQFLMSVRGISGTARHLGAAPGSREDTGLTAAQLFALLWSALSDALGTPATAVLVRQSARAAVLHDLDVHRDQLEFTYLLPPAWSDLAPAGLEELGALCRALRPLLVELTGTVVLRSLESVAPLRASGLLERECGAVADA